MLVGEEGAGWRQVTGELTLERSGPERYLTTFPLVAAAVEAIAASPALSASDTAVEGIGRLVAQHAVLRQMSLSVSGMLQQGEDPAIEAAVVKDIGNGLEQRVPEVVRELLDAPTPGTSGADLHRLLSFQFPDAPSF